jgi:hypothetical protein
MRDFVQRRHWPAPHITRVVLTCLAALWLAGCAHYPEPPAGTGAGLTDRWETPNAAREITLKAEGRWVELAFRADDDGGEARLNRQIIRIERAHVVWNGRTVAAISPLSRDFKVTLTGGTLEVLADGASVFRRDGVN